MDIEAKLTVFEIDAARMLDFHNYDKKNINEMAADLRNWHDDFPMYQNSLERFENLTASKVNQLKLYVQDLRSKARVPGNLRTIMTEDKVEKKLKELDYDDYEAIKEWFYELFPSPFTREHITQRHEKAVKRFCKRKLRALNEFDAEQLMREAALWAEYHEWDWDNCQEEMVQDLFESINNLKHLVGRRCEENPPAGPQIDERTCLGAVLAYKEDPSDALKLVEEDRGELDEMNEDAFELNGIIFDMIARMRGEDQMEPALRPAGLSYPPSELELDDVTKLLFVDFWNDYTAEAIREYVRYLFAPV